MNGWLIALLLVIVWLALLLLLKRKNMVKGTLSFYGPALMLKTKRGVEWIKKWSKHRFWIFYGDFSIALSLVFLILMFLLILWQAVYITIAPPSNAPSPLQAIGIPGINPVIPVGYGILGLIVAIVFHEMSHGFLVAAQKLRIKSLGILLFIIPIGAFVEPDDEELMRTSRRKRMRVFAAGPTTNIVLAILILLLMMGMMSGVSPKYDAFYVADNFTENPNYQILPVGTIILSINGTEIKSFEDYMNVQAPLPGEKVRLRIYNGDEVDVEAYSGVIISSVLRGYPASEAGLKPGWIFYSINGTVVRNQEDFYHVLNLTRAGQRVEISMFHPPNRWFNTTVVMADKYDYFERYAPQLNEEWYRGKGFLGVGATYLGVGLGNASVLKNIIGNPFYYAKSPGDYFRSFMGYIALPFAGLMPFPDSLAHIYTVPFHGFWIIFNSLYWIFWLNLMLGMTNLLPAVPLDGGFVFKDAVIHVAKRLKIKNAEKFGVELSTFLSFLILFLILWQFIAPRI